MLATHVIGTVKLKNQEGKLPIFLALDVDTQDQALDLVRQTKDYISAYKVGPRLFLTCGKHLIQEIKACSSARIFLDFKFYDIPSSTLEAVRSAFLIGADFVTVHAGVGRETLRLLSQFEKEALQKRFFQILCVTVLSSVQDSTDHQDKVLALTDQIYQAGLRGLVCSPLEVKSLRQKYRDMFFVTPGIRLKSEADDDQKRVMSPKEALDAGSSALVMGRSLIRSKNIVETLKSISHYL